MRKVLLASALVAALGGCGVLWPTNSEENPQDVVDFAVQLCNFRPTVESVVRMLTAENPIVVGGFQIALAICTAVSPQQSMGLLDVKPENPEECPKVNEVCVEGAFEPQTPKKEGE